eukprot:12139586-Karenia_brevis.AAC.1
MPEGAISTSKNAFHQKASDQGHNYTLNKCHSTTTWWWWAQFPMSQSAQAMSINGWGKWGRPSLITDLPQGKL